MEIKLINFFLKLNPFIPFPRWEVFDLYEILQLILRNWTNWNINGMEKYK